MYPRPSLCSPSSTHSLTHTSPDLPSQALRAQGQLCAGERWGGGGGEAQLTDVGRAHPVLWQEALSVPSGSQHWGGGHVPSPHPPPRSGFLEATTIGSHIMKRCQHHQGRLQSHYPKVPKALIYTFHEHRAVTSGDEFPRIFKNQDPINGHLWGEGRGSWEMDGERAVPTRKAISLVHKTPGPRKWKNFSEAGRRSLGNTE